MAAGYDLPFIQKHGLSDADLDCVTIPATKLGLRKKLMALHQIEKFTDPLDDASAEADGSDEDDGGSADEESDS